ncbi:MAG TPA: glycosyltransferase family 39 protein [Planctomycetota bacterium]|nr:glycosyltransferase family 39 protein [Planctomycetota bacterium]
MPDSQWTVLLLASAFLVRVVAAMGSAIFGTDSCHYLLMADWMRAGRLQEALAIAYHPFYPLLIAAMRTFTGSTEQAGTAVSVLVGAAAVIPLFHMVRSVFGRPAGVLASLLYAFHPILIEVQSDVMTEGTFLFFLFGSMWLTWRVMEEPSLARAAVLGAAAAAAFLTRPEGLLALALAVAWPALEAIRRRNGWARRLGGLGATVAVAALLAFPYLLWVKSERGHWALSPKPSVMSAEKAVVGLGGDPGDETGSSERARLYRIYAVSLYHQSYYGLLVPFTLLGLWRLGEVGARRALFYLSFPLGHLGGILFTLRSHNFMSERYVLAGTLLLGGLAAYGMVIVLRAAAVRWPESPLRPALCSALLFLLLAVPTLLAFKVRRTEYLGFPVAAQGILARDPHPGTVGGIEQVSYLCGSRSYYLPATREGLDQFVADKELRYIVYSDRDVQKRPDYVGMLRSWDRLEAPREYSGPPGAWKVYVQRVR